MIFGDILKHFSEQGFREIGTTPHHHALGSNILRLAETLASLAFISHKCLSVHLLGLSAYLACRESGRGRAPGPVGL